MKLILLIPFIFSIFLPVFAEGHKRYKKEDFEEIKFMKIEYLNKRINCVKDSNNFMEMKKCLKKRKKY